MDVFHLRLARVEGKVPDIFITITFGCGNPLKESSQKFVIADVKPNETAEN